MPEYLKRSMQHNVTWQTGSEYHMLTAPNGRTLNYVSFVRKIQIPEIFGSPLIYAGICQNVKIMLQVDAY